MSIQEDLAMAAFRRSRIVLLLVPFLILAAVGASVMHAQSTPDQTPVSPSATPQSASLPACQYAQPSPEAVTVTPPDPSVPAQLAAFSGVVWETKWAAVGSQDFAYSQLIIEQVTTTSVTAIYMFYWPGHLYEWGPTTYTAAPDGTLRTPGNNPPILFTFAMAADGRSIAAQRTQGGNAVTGTFTPCMPIS
jgi:hypothetical protein